MYIYNIYTIIYAQHVCKYERGKVYNIKVLKSSSVCSSAGIMVFMQVAANRF